MRYEATFSPNTKMRARLDAIVKGEPDPYPNSSGSGDVEKMIQALGAGEKNPYSEVRLSTKVRERKPNEYPIVEPVARAFIELFENLNRGDHGRRSP